MLMSVVFVSGVVFILVDHGSVILIISLYGFGLSVVWFCVFLFRFDYLLLFFGFYGGGCFYLSFI